MRHERARALRNRPVLFGAALTVKELAALAGCLPPTASARLRLGWTPEEVVRGERFVSVKRVPAYRPPPQPDSLTTLAKQHGILRKTLGRRVRGGMPLEKALTTPVRPCDNRPLVGMRFGHLTVGTMVRSDPKSTKLFYGADCDCGKMRFVLRHDLMSGAAQTCLDPACPYLIAFRAARKQQRRRRPRALRNPLVGKRFGLYQVTAHIAKGWYRADCDCGNLNQKVHRDKLQQQSPVPSCGCARVWIPQVGEQIGKMRVLSVSGTGKNRIVRVACAACEKEVDVDRLVLGRRRMLIRLGRESGSCGCAARRVPQAYKGQMLLMTEIAKAEGIPMEGLSRHLKNGLPMEAAIEAARTHAARFASRVQPTLHGRPVTAAQLAEIAGIDANTMGYRLRAGWTVEEALSGMRNGKFVARKSRRSGAAV